MSKEIEKVSVAMDQETIEIINKVSPALRNAAILIAIKMFSESSIYKNYFCNECEKIDDTEELENLSVDTATKTQESASQPVVSFDDFGTF